MIWLLFISIGIILTLVHIYAYDKIAYDKACLRYAKNTIDKKDDRIKELEKILTEKFDQDIIPEAPKNIKRYRSMFINSDIDL